ncbi:MAG TPA: Gfo/Idh/MocA family oxidoreductase [Chthonomonadaceae bacterium]|nr:Gfo/Idh/MocA family oxidoreductase [Chthonomonadaceae bacterium]
MDKITRRRFLEQSLLTAAAAVTGLGLEETARAERRGRRVGPNDRIHVACVGVHGRGMSHVGAFAGREDTEVVAICDVDESVIPKAQKAVTDRNRPTPKAVQDIRRLLEDTNIDVVSIATPNHWHALAAIWAMQAGKDVYVEKPVSHNVLEGRRMVEAARKYGRICQAGTQIRSSKGSREAIEYIHSGKIGKVFLARGLCYKPRGSIGKYPDSAVPPGVDYDLWLGPAPTRPFNRNRFHYNWHWNWDYGNGDLGNQGIHQMDVARWALNKHALPQNVLGLGGRFGYVDDGETPNTELTFFDYGDAQLIFEVRGLNTPDLKGAKIGNIIYGTEGYVVFPGYDNAVVLDNRDQVVAKFEGGGDHFGNFLDAVRSRRHTDLRGDIEEGHLSSALCHLGNISYRLGEMQPFNTKTGAFGDDKEAIETFARFEQHLADNGIRLQDTSYRLGPRLRFDPKAERFRDNARANALLTREYRKPFVVPERV